MKQQMINALGSAHELEVLYRGSPQEFIRVFPEVFAEHPDAPILQAWRARLLFENQREEKRDVKPSRWTRRDIWLTVALALGAGTLAKLPQLFSALDAGRFYSRNVSGIVVGALIVFFLVQKPSRTPGAARILILLLAAGLYLNFLPHQANSQTVVLSCLHMPLFLWSLLGVAFMGGSWKDRAARMEFVRYSGELLIFTTVILIGGMVLTGLTFALFGMIDMKIEDWYLRNVVVYGAVASPIVATLLIERIVDDRFKIAPLLAKLFTPLFFLTAVSYLLAMTLNNKSPFTNRDFLVAFNGLLLVVLGLCVFSVSERAARESSGISDMLNIGLVSVTLVIDLIALAAILFRLASYGFTPNRLAVLGANLLAFVHLAGIVSSSMRTFRAGRVVPDLEKWIVGYLPVYTAWSLIVAVGFPLLFRFR